METRGFAAVTDRLAELGISLGDVADCFGVRRETVSRWRREGGRFPPPDNWRETLAQLGESRSAELSRYAQELKRSS